ncbi:unnamed protein product, partial [Prorocentrum cordatum]
DHGSASARPGARQPAVRGGAPHGQGAAQGFVLPSSDDLLPVLDRQQHHGPRVGGLRGRLGVHREPRREPEARPAHELHVGVLRRPASVHTAGGRPLLARARRAPPVGGVPARRHLRRHLALGQRRRRPGLRPAGRAGQPARLVPGPEPAASAGGADPVPGAAGAVRRWWPAVTRGAAEGLCHGAGVAVGERGVPGRVPGLGQPPGAPPQRQQRAAEGAADPGAAAAAHAPLRVRVARALLDAARRHAAPGPGHQAARGPARAGRAGRAGGVLLPAGALPRPGGARAASRGDA